MINFGSVGRFLPSRYYYVKRSFDSHIRSHEGKKFECTYPGCGKKLSRQVSDIQ